MRTMHFDFPRRVYLAAAVGVVSALATSVGVAGNATSNMPVTASISAACTLSAGTLASGSYDPVGANASTPAAPLRQLASGASRLAYFLYRDSGHTTVWGNAGVAAPTGTGAGVTNTVYGRVTAGQNKPAGSYTDTVVATITY